MSERERERESEGEGQRGGGAEGLRSRISWRDLGMP